MIQCIFSVASFLEFNMGVTTWQLNDGINGDFCGFQRTPDRKDKSQMFFRYVSCQIPNLKTTGQILTFLNLFSFLRKTFQTYLGCFCSYSFVRFVFRRFFCGVFHFDVLQCCLLSTWLFCSNSSRHLCSVSFDVAPLITEGQREFYLPSDDFRVPSASSNETLCLYTSVNAFRRSDPVKNAFKRTRGY